MALRPPGHGVRALGGIGDVQLQAVRRVVEIRDGMLTLAPYGRPTVLQTAERDTQASGLDAHDARAVAEAAWLRAAVAAKSAGQPPNPSATAPAGGGHDLAEEIAWLSRIAAVIHRPPRSSP